ncbi:MAG: glycosyltransferase family 4 protein [Firmicutes bacterium]|nr:glycosyltransferase family 4 protein [Bacillota bacterium]
MKILHINSYYSTSNFYKNLYDSQKEHGLNIDVYVFVSTSDDVSKLKLGNYTTISKNHGKYDRYIFHLKHLKILSDIQTKFDIRKYSILHAHSLFSNGYIAYKLKQKYNTPYIVAVRNTDVNLFFKKIFYLRKTGINILRNAEKIMFLSEPYKKETIDKLIPYKYKKEIADKSIVIPNGIDKYWLENKLKERIIPNDNRIGLVYAGQINDNKNIETTIKACELLMEQGYDITYKIIGKIMDKRYIDIIKGYSFIEYIPYCRKEKLINHYRNSDIFIMPSEHETFGLVYAEAMSQGLPVIYSRGQGFDGQFEDGLVGYSVQYNSPEEIAKKVIVIINNYESISQNCINKVDKFNWNKIADKYIEIYKG